MDCKFLFATLSAALLALNCAAQGNDNSTWDNVKEGASNTWTNVKTGTTQAWATVKEGSSNAWTTVKEGTTQTWSEVKEKFQSGSETTTNYVYSQKDEFVAKTRAGLNRLDQQMDQLSKKAATANDSVKAEAQQKLKALKSERADLDKKFDAAKKATAADWKKTQDEFQNAYDKTANSVRMAWDWLKSKTG